MSDNELVKETNRLLQKFYKEELTNEEKRKLKNMLGILRDRVETSIDKVPTKA